MKISKKRLANKVRKLEVQNYDMRQKIKKMDELLTYLDELTTELNHALPDPEYDAKCEAVADVEASLNRHRERLGLNKPKLKQIDQSVFDGLDEKWRFAAVDGCTGRAYVYEQKPHIMHIKRQYWRIDDGLQHIVGDDYDASNWQNSLIERDAAKELTGSELCKAMLKRGDRVNCYVDDDSDYSALNDKDERTIIGFSDGWFHTNSVASWKHAVPINNQGEPLTAAEAGL